MLLAIFPNGIEQCTAHFQVINKVYPTKPYGLCIPLFIGFMIDDSSHTTNYLALLIGQIKLCFAEFKGCILLRVQHLCIVTIQCRCIIFIPLVKLIMEFDEGF